ncbi:MAG: hypothetical protein RL283_1526, partial [Actinomycetota bacterium]
CQAVFDVLVAGARSVTLFGFDFNQSSLIGETPWEMCRKLGDQGMLNQYLFLRQLWTAGLVKADETGRRALALGVEHYADRLEGLYGDWSLGGDR